MLLPCFIAQTEQSELYLTKKIIQQKRWVKSSNENSTITIGMPGIGNVEHKFARFCEKDVLLPTNEWASSTVKKPLCKKFFIGTIVSDTCPAKINARFNINPLRLLKSASADIEVFNKNKKISKWHYFSQNLKNKTLGKYIFAPLNPVLCQKRAFDCHRKKMLTLCYVAKKNNKNPNVVLFGYSRGAAATLTSFANNYHLDCYKNVKLLVLQSPFQNISTAISEFYGTITNKLPKRLINLSLKAGQYIAGYDLNGPMPENMLDKIPKNVPIVFIASLSDKKVPYKRTQYLAEQLVRHGHQNVYFITLENATHNTILFHNEKDTHTYLTSLHAIYKKYDLAYIPEYADQLTDEDVDKLNLSLQVKRVK